MVTFYEIKQNKKEQNDYNSWILKGHLKKTPIFPMFLVGGRCQCVFMTLFMHDKMKLCGST